MLGFYTCPYCQTHNACDCNACSKHITEYDVVMLHSDDGENIKCGSCKKEFTPDQSLNASDKFYNENNKN